MKRERESTLERAERREGGRRQGLRATRAVGFARRTGNWGGDWNQERILRSSCSAMSDMTPS